MEGLALQIDGKWAVLDEDTSVSIESTSPIWGEGRSFSFAFSLDMESNRHIIGNSDQLTGQSVYEMLDGKRAVLYTLGIPTYYGKIQLEDEVEIDDGYVDITLVSGNLTFDEMIDGMNCRDVELIDKIVIGERLTEFSVKFTASSGQFTRDISGFFPTYFMHMRNNGKSTVNESDAYPIAKYCNTRICYRLPEKNAEGEDYDYSRYGVDAIKNTIKEKLEEVVNEGDFGTYVVLGADRPLSGLCFYVLYFLDCLFYKLGYAWDHSSISYMEDLKRLAFCVTRCAYDEENVGVNVGWDYLQGILNGTFMGQTSSNWTISSMTLSAPLKRCIANSKNFPDEEVSSVIEALESGFGIRFLADEKSQKMTCVYVRDVLKNTEVKSIRSVECYEVRKVENGTRGFLIKYASGSEDDTSYNYSDWNKNVVKTDSYNSMMRTVSAYDKNLYIDTRIGNAYRVKIDEEATKTSEKNPSIVEIGAFNPVEYGDCSNEDRTEKVEIPFTPVTMNDTSYKKRRTVVRNSKKDYLDGRENSDQTFSFFVNAPMKYPSCPSMITISFEFGGVLREFKYSYLDLQRFDESRTDQTKSALREEYKGKRLVDVYVTPEQFENESPIQSYDTGLMFGIMRGPGSGAGVEEFGEDYDGEGNYRYVMTAKNSAFHSDTVDNYSRAWDYNGTEAGGVETEGSISLKLRAEKPNPEGGFYPVTEAYAQKRGLFDKFYAEYAYFVTHRKIVKITCGMELADLLNIDWTVRYKIGDYVGFINKYSYTIDKDGIRDITIELYYL